MTGKKAIEVLEKVFSGNEEEMPKEEEINDALNSLKQVVDSKKPKGLTLEEIENFYASRKARLVVTKDFLKELRKQYEKGK